MTYRQMPRIIFFIHAVIITALCSGCSSIGYYAQMIGGHIEIHSQTQPIESVINNPETEDKLKHKLLLIQEAKEFAVNNLDLPQNNSYSDYVDLGRKYVLWSVTAAPKLSLKPYQSCFPIVGCMSYKTFFSKDDANKFANSLKQQGYDTYVAGIAAFSSLGWFDDPIINTMLSWRDTRLAGLIFHELTHQKIYIANDTTFNESIAVAVELEGIKKWLKHSGKEDKLDTFIENQKRHQQFLDLVLNTRQQLKSLYQSQFSEYKKSAEKKKLFAELIKDYETLKQSWKGYSGYDRWFNTDLNNAKLALLSTYTQYVPAFTQLLHNHNGDFANFFIAAKDISKMEKEKRNNFLNSLPLKK